MHGDIALPIHSTNFVCPRHSLFVGLASKVLVGIAHSLLPVSLIMHLLVLAKGNHRMG
jgi:hypothetical protein